MCIAILNYVLLSFSLTIGNHWYAAQIQHLHPVITNQVLLIGEECGGTGKLLTMISFLKLKLVTFLLKLIIFFVNRN